MQQMKTSMLLRDVNSSGRSSIKKFYAPKHLKIKSILNKEIIKFCYVYGNSLYTDLSKFKVHCHFSHTLLILFNNLKTNIYVTNFYRVPILAV